MPAESSDSPKPARLSEDEAHRLLARAAELDAHIGTSLSVAQLREIAAEAGISSDAFDAALREYEAQGLTALVREVPAGDVGRSARRRLVERLARHRVLAAVAIFLGAAFASPGDLIWTTLIVSAPLYAVYELCIAVARSRKRPPSLPPVSPTDGADGSPPRTPPSAPVDRVLRSLLLRTA